MTQKIWCTYHSAGSLLAGGLERVDVWFSEPVWETYTRIDDIKEYLESNPFQLSEREGLPSGNYWTANKFSHGSDKQKHSFAKLYGYDCKLALFVWKKLCKHFGSQNLHDWYDKERAGEISPMTFLLEIDLEITDFKLKNELI